MQRHRSVALTRCETLEASRDEMKRRLDEFTDVLNISPDDVHLSSQNLGSGSFAGECHKYLLFKFNFGYMTKAFPWANGAE